MYKILGKSNVKLDDLMNAVMDRPPEEREQFMLQMKEELQDQIAREQVLNDFVGTRQDEVPDLIREKEERTARMVALLANEADREELVSSLYDKITSLEARSFARGVLGGKALAESFAKLKKRKPPNKTIKKIMLILMNNPKAKTKEIFLALDDDCIELYRSTTVPKHVRSWKDVINEPYYKNLVSRLRKKVRIRKSQEMLDSINTFQGVKRKDFVS